MQFHLRWSPGGSDGEAEAGPSGCGSTNWRVQEIRPHIPIYAGVIAMASILMQESCLLCGGACLTG